MMKLTVKTQATLILMYFASVHLFGIIASLMGYIKRYPEILGLYLLLVFSSFVLIYFKQHLVFSSTLEEERKDLFDKNVQIIPFSLERKMFIKFSSLFREDAYKSLTGELALRRILVRNCSIYLILTFILIALIGTLSIP